VGFIKEEIIEGIDPSVNVMEAPTIAPSPKNIVNRPPLNSQRVERVSADTW